MKVIGYYIYGKSYCMNCVNSFDLDLDEEELEPIFSGDYFSYPLKCEECGEVFLEAEVIDLDFTEIDEEEEEIIEDEGEEVEEEEEEVPILTCSLCPISDCCPFSGDLENIRGHCIPGFFYDLEEEGGGDE